MKAKSGTPETLDSDGSKDRKSKERGLKKRMNQPKKETDGILVADEIKHLKEMEVWYVKALKGLNLECSRLETEIDRIKKNKNVHDLKSEYEHLKQLEVWYIKALKGLNTMCSRLEEEINRLKSENVRLKERTKRTSLEEELSSAEKRLARFLNNAGDPTKTLLKAILFSENDLGLDMERITTVLPAAFPAGMGLTREDIETSIKELEKNDILKTDGTKLTIPEVMKKYLRMHVLDELAGESDLREVMAEDDAIIDLFEIMHERHGRITPQELNETHANPEELEKVLCRLLKRNIVLCGLNRDGKGTYVIPEELLRTIDSLKIDVIVKKASEKRPDRTELMKKLKIREPSGDDMDALLEMYRGTSGEIGGSEIILLGEALKNGDVDYLINALKDKDVSIRRFATSALWKAGSKAAIKPLQESLKDRDPYVRRLTVSALWKIGGKDLIDQLICMLDDKDAMVRYSVVSYLDFVSDKKTVEPLINALKDDDDMVRTVAASALGNMKDERAIGPLVEALSDDNGWVRNCAAEALEEIKLGRQSGPGRPGKESKPGRRDRESKQVRGG